MQCLARAPKHVAFFFFFSTHVAEHAEAALLVLSWLVSCKLQGLTSLMASENIRIKRVEEKIHTQSTQHPTDAIGLYSDFQSIANTSQGCVCAHGNCIKRVFDITQRSRGMFVGGFANHGAGCSCCNGSRSSQHADGMQHVSSFATMIEEIRASSAHCREPATAQWDEKNKFEAE